MVGDRTFKQSVTKSRDNEAETKSQSYKVLTGSGLKIIEKQVKAPKIRRHDTKWKGAPMKARAKDDGKEYIKKATLTYEVFALGDYSQQYGDAQADIDQFFERYKGLLAS